MASADENINISKETKKWRKKEERRKEQKRYKKMDKEIRQNLECRGHYDI